VAIANGVWDDDPLEYGPEVYSFGDSGNINQAQSQCLVVNDAADLTLTCPNNGFFEHLKFVSYGNPTGSCAASNLAITEGCTLRAEITSVTVRDLCQGRTTCTIHAGVGGNSFRLPLVMASMGSSDFVVAPPRTGWEDCGGITKKLAVDYGCADKTFYHKSTIDELITELKASHNCDIIAYWATPFYDK